MKIILNDMSDVFSNPNLSCYIDLSNILCIILGKEKKLVHTIHNISDVFSNDNGLCVTYMDDMKKLSCFGYMFEYLNGETIVPIPYNVSFQGEVINDFYKGYNFVISQILYINDILYDRAIKDVEMDQFKTCVTLETDDKVCYGGEIPFKNVFESFMIGLFVTIALSLPVFILVRKYAYFVMVYVLLVPVIVYLPLFLVVFKTSAFIVNTTSFFIGSVLAIYFTYKIVEYFHHDKKVEDINRDESEEDSFVNKVDDMAKDDDTGTTTIEISNKK